jgi:O-antigen/teichoic acid export membrane protein
VTAAKPQADSGGRTAKDFALVIVGKALSVGALFACSVVAARAGGPEVFGLYSAAIAMILLLDAIIGSPLDYAAVRFGAVHENEHARVDRFQAATFRIKLTLGVLMVTIALLARHPLACLFFSDPEQSTLVGVVIVSTFALMLVRSTSASLQIQKKFLPYSIFDASQAVLRFTLLATVALLGARSALALVGVFGVASAILFAAGLLIVRQTYILARWPERSDARAILTFITATTAIITLGSITGRADILIISAIHSGDSGESVGIYGAAAQLAMLGTMLAGYACIVFQPRVIPLARQRRLGSLLRVNLIGGLIVGVLAAPVVIWALPDLITLILGDDYARTTPLLQIMLIGTWLDLLFMPVLMTFALQVRPSRALIGEVFITIAFFAAVPLVVDGSLLAMAWLVTGIRVLKMMLYTFITLTNLDPDLLPQPTAQRSA